MSEIEGLICPECFKEFSSVNQLSIHFQSFHSDTNSDNNSISNIFKKAKGSIDNILSNKQDIFLKFNNELDDKPNFFSFAFYETTDRNCYGFTLNKTEEFKKFRYKSMRQEAIELSAIVFKLEKFSEYPFSNSTTKDIRKFEKSLTEWIDDDLVSICPTCGCKFGFNSKVTTSSDLTDKTSSKLVNAFNYLLEMKLEIPDVIIRRKHHCRLCGSLICAICSYNLPISQVNEIIEMINSKSNYVTLYSQNNISSIQWKHESTSSLDSKQNSNDTEYNVRCCIHCKWIIEKRIFRCELQNTQNDITEMHKEFKGLMMSVETASKDYQDMYYSLMEGKSHFSYDQVFELRSEIVTKCQRIDRIGNVFKSKSLSTQVNREASLFVAISRNCLMFLQEHFAILKDLPSREKIIELSETRLKNIRDAAAKEIYSNQTLHFVKKPPKEGWAPYLPQKSGSFSVSLSYGANNNPFDELSLELSPDSIHLNLIAEQIENVRQYLEQARKAGRTEEVLMLKQNMTDLETEFETISKRKETL